MKKLLLALLVNISTVCVAQTFYSITTNTYAIYGLSSDTKPVSPPDNCYFIEVNTNKTFISASGSWSLVGIGVDSIATRLAFVTDSLATALAASVAATYATITTVNGKQATLVSGTNIKTINGSTVLGSGDLVVSGGAVAWDDVTGKPTTTSWLSNSANKNFVTDAQATVIGNTSGSNSGDNATNTQYSGLAASKQDVNSNLTTIAGLTATTDNFMVSASSAWASRTPTQAKTSLLLNNVENTAVSTWAGTANITILGTVATGTWNATAIADGKIASALTGKTYNGLTITTSTGTLTIANGKTATVNNSVTIAGTDGVTTTMPAVAGTVMLNTSTAGVGTSPTATSTVTITHNLGRVPTIIRIYGYGIFTSNAAATATTSSMGIWNSSGNFCVYQRYGAAITTTQAGLSSNAFAILLATGGGSFISGVIQNVTSTGFDLSFTETGTATAQPYLWEAQ